jgi:hypothetical protein
MISRAAVLRLGSTGCQPVAFGRRAECFFARSAISNIKTEWSVQFNVHSKLPRTTGQRPVLPGTGTAR